jgi:hypothetical protein
MRLPKNIPAFQEKHRAAPQSWNPGFSPPRFLFIPFVPPTKSAIAPSTGRMLENIDHPLLKQRSAFVPRRLRAAGGCALAQS